MPARATVAARRTRAIERITNRSRPYSNRLFDGDSGKGFLFWAVDLHLDQTDNGPTEDDLLANITDASDDLELDAYFIDESSLTIYLFQSKYRSSPTNLRMNDLTNFLDVPRKLTSSQILAGISNESILQFAPTFRRYIVDGYELQLVYLTTMRAQNQVRTRANVWSEEQLSLSIGGEYVDVPHSAIIVDIDDLIQIVDSLQTIREIQIDLEIDHGTYHQTNSGGFRCLIATISLESLAKAFDEHRFAILRYNPRGPLGSVAVNKDIKQTLEDPVKRERFQLMNNGLSAVCAAFTPPAEDDLGTFTHIRDFQIVNGCQTTYNVYDYWRRGLPLGDSKVTLKLVEDPSSQLRHLISSASNKQSQMKDWDFLFDQPDQQRLQSEFQLLSPPIFYELRRGEHKYISGNEISERATVKDIAQATWAFMGNRGEAKDKIREIPRTKERVTGPYRTVFFPSVKAEQLRLPWLVYRKVQEEWKIYSNTTGHKGDHREHGRLHLLWLIGRGLTLSRNADRYQDVPIAQVRQLTVSIDDWFPILPALAIDTIDFVVEVKRSAAQETGEAFSLRQLFRSARYYEDFARRHNRLIDESDLSVITAA